VPGYAALFAIGFVSAVLNVIGGGGSFLTLPLLIFFGLPPSIANGTNRVGVLAQTGSAVFGFHRHNVLPVKWAIVVSIPAMAGAAIGVWAALNVPDLAFKRILSIVMLAVALGTLVHRTIRGDRRGEPRAASDPLTLAGFFLTGVYGGFLQAGVGFLVLAVTTMAGLDLLRGNAVKVFAVLLLTLLSLLVFAGAGQVHWPAGLALAFGSFLGGLAGVHLAVLKGQRWLERIVSVTIVLFAILLWASE
jgi:uncharacterized membrane protein YfcA